MAPYPNYPVTSKWLRPCLTTAVMQSWWRWCLFLHMAYLTILSISEHNLYFPKGGLFRLSTKCLTTAIDFSLIYFPQPEPEPYNLFPLSRRKMCRLWGKLKKAVKLVLPKGYFFCGPIGQCPMSMIENECNVFFSTRRCADDYIKLEVLGPSGPHV